MTETERLCTEIAEQIDRAHSHHGEYGGFSWAGKQKISAALAELIAAVKAEVIQELRSEK